jgi:hypothetical protein
MIRVIVIMLENLMAEKRMAYMGVNHILKKFYQNQLQPILITLKYLIVQNVVKK